jgi:UDP-N-acetyl-2-amino-2-deoxyglucuronate dehydrogenase
MDKLRIGVVGCGHISKKHFDAIIENSEQFQLIAACDKSEATKQKIQAEHSIEVYSDIEGMIKSSELDIISLCTPSGLHPGCHCSITGYPCDLRETTGTHIPGCQNNDICI